MARFATLPKISIVTPSFNQGAFLEDTLRSVLDQKYPNLEYLVIDGGSTDNSVDIIQRYADQLTYWVSEKDRGQNHALNKGFARATGDILAYLNSDDKYLPWTFDTVARIFSDAPQVEWLTSQTPMMWDEQGRAIEAYQATRHARTWFYRGWTLGNHAVGKGAMLQTGWIQQEGTFWTRGLWERAGARMAEDFYMAGDFELWARFWQHANLTTTVIPLAGYRKHKTNKTTDDEYAQICYKVLARYPNESIRNPLVLWLAEQLYKFTKRGGRRFGSTVNWVQYNFKTQRWNFHSQRVI